MKKVELSTLLQQRNLPYSGNKDVLVRRLEESDRSRSSVATSELATGEDSAAAQFAGHEFEYITVCRPFEDVAAEKGANGLDDDTSDELIDEEDEEYDGGKRGEDGQPKSTCGRRECICKLPASELPEHRWILTYKGYPEVARLQWEVLRRDQDAVGLHFCSDYNGYGFQEVMENQLLSFNREFSNRRTREGDTSSATLWSIIEGFAWILNDPLPWFYVDNPATTLETLQMIGGAVFTTLDAFEKNGLLGADSPVKNIALVLGVLYNNTRDWPGNGDEPELEWRGAMIREALQLGIEVKGQPYGIEEVLKKDGVNGTQPSKENSKWKEFDWAKKFRAFSKKHKKGSTIGGRYYVLASARD